MKDRLMKIISFGTEGYPEPVARRLRAVNIAAWTVAIVPLVLGTLRLSDPDRWAFGLGTVAIASATIATPLLHRFGTLAAPVALSILVYFHLFRLTNEIGIGGGAQLGYLSAVGAVMLFVGVEHVRVAIALSILAIGFLIFLQLTAPQIELLESMLPFAFSNFIVNVISNAIILFVVVYYSVWQTARAEQALEREFSRSESLLENIMPPAVAARLKEQEVIADSYEEASVLFADMQGFTQRASQMNPTDLVEFLNETFTRIDDLVEAHGLEKIKTSGDAYLVVSGIPSSRSDHADSLAEFALAMRDSLSGLTDPLGRPVKVRIGMAAGPVVAGVVGQRRFFYDIWGDAVNVASRMEQTGEPGRIQVSDDIHEILNDRFMFEDRGRIEVHGKGMMRTWFLIEKS